MDTTSRYFVIVMVAAAGIIAGSALSNADSRPAAADAVATSAPESFVYFPAQFTLDAPATASDHIQAF